MKKLLFALFLFPIITFAQTATTTPATTTPPAILQNIIDTDRRPEIVVTKEGVMTLRNVKITQIVGTTLFTRLIWENMFLRLTVKTNTNTKFFRRYGEPTNRAELAEGDYLNIDGALESGGDSFSMLAGNVADLAVLKEMSEFHGNVGAVMPDANAFTVFTTKYGPVRVSTASSTIIKGSLTIQVSGLYVGDKILSVSGEYNHSDNSLVATAISVYVDLKQFKPRNYEATLTTINSPTSLTVKSEGGSYSVVLAGDTVLKNKARKVVPFKRFVEGDSLIIYGATSESATTTITAEVIRNLSL